MSSKIITDYYNPLLEKSSFIPVSCGERFSKAGSCWQLSPEIGGGYYWVYAQKDLFDIKIHDFFFHEDFILTFDIPECISISRLRFHFGRRAHPLQKVICG